MRPSPASAMLLTLSSLLPGASAYISGAGVLHLAGTGATLACPSGSIISAIAGLL